MEMNKQKKKTIKKQQQKNRRLNSNIMVDKVGKLSELIIIITGKSGVLINIYLFYFSKRTDVRFLIRRTSGMLF